MRMFGADIRCGLGTVVDRCRLRGAVAATALPPAGCLAFQPRAEGSLLGRCCGACPQGVRCRELVLTEIARARRAQSLLGPGPIASGSGSAARVRRLNF